MNENMNQEVVMNNVKPGKGKAGLIIGGILLVGTVIGAITYKKNTTKHISVDQDVADDEDFEDSFEEDFVDDEE